MAEIEVVSPNLDDVPDSLFLIFPSRRLDNRVRRLTVENGSHESDCSDGLGGMVGGGVTC